MCVQPVASHKMHFCQLKEQIMVHRKEFILVLLLFWNSSSGFFAESWKQKHGEQYTWGKKTHAAHSTDQLHYCILDRNNASNALKMLSSRFSVSGAQEVIKICALVGCINVPATCLCISGTDLLNFTCCHTGTEIADRTFSLWHYTDTELTRPSADLWHKVPGRVATGVPISKSLVWLQISLQRKQRSNPVSGTLCFQWPLCVCVCVCVRACAPFKQGDPEADVNKDLKPVE